MVGLGIGGHGKEEADRTLVIAPPNGLKNCDQYRLIEIRKPVIEKIPQGNGYKKWYKHVFGGFQTVYIGNPGDIGDVLKLAEERVEKYKNNTLSDKTALWRRERTVSDRQAAQLEKFGVDVSKINGKPGAKGDAGRILTYYFAMETLKKKGVLALDKNKNALIM